MEVMKFEIPSEFVSKNLSILIKGGSKIVSLYYYSTDLKVTMIENYGEVKI